MQAWSKFERWSDRVEVKPFVDRFGSTRLEASANFFAYGVVDCLMALCDRLEADLLQMQTQSEKRMGTTVARASCN